MATKTYTHTHTREPSTSRSGYSASRYGHSQPSYATTTTTDYVFSFFNNSSSEPIPIPKTIRKKSQSPIRSASPDPHADIDFGALPPNAFGIMHTWELESLEKWQKRLEHVRMERKLLKAKIESLKQDEQTIWAESAKYARYQSKQWSSSSSEEEEDEGPAYGSRARSRQATNEFDEYLQLIRSEIAALQDELAECAESEDKARKGIQKATARLERLRGLEGRWKAPDATPESSRASSRASSPTPEPRPQTRRNSTASRPNLRSEHTTAQPGSPPKPTRRATEPIPNIKVTYSYSKPLQPQTKFASLDPWLSYEDRWHQLQTNPADTPMVLRFSSIPWPMARTPSNSSKINVHEIREFLLHPRMMKGQDKGVPDVKARRALLRAAILRWHPDKFLTKFLPWVVEEEKAAVKEGVGKVIQCLNEIMRMEAVRSKTL